MRPRSSCCSYCRCHSVRALDGAARTLVPMRSQSAMEQVRIETLHPRQMLPSKAASMRRAALPVAARNRPQAARRHRVAAAWCLLRETCCGLSPACRPLQPPLVVRLASDRVALSRRRASTTSQARNASWWKIRSLRLPTKSGVWYRRERLLSSAHPHCRRHIRAGGGCSRRRWTAAGRQPPPGGLLSVGNCRPLSVADTRRRFGFHGVVAVFGMSVEGRAHPTRRQTARAGVDTTRHASLRQPWHWCSVYGPLWV